MLFRRAVPRPYSSFNVTKPSNAGMLSHRSTDSQRVTRNAQLKPRSLLDQSFRNLLLTLLLHNP